MPYITQEARIRLTQPGTEVSSAGELNYLLTLRAMEYLRRKGELRYANINHVIGSFDMAVGEDHLLVDEEHDLAREFRYLMKRAVKAGAVNPTDARGAMRCAQMELYRRIAVPYEDSMIRVNGDVYHGWIA